MSESNPDNTLPVDSPDRKRLPPLLRRAWYSLNQALRRRIAPTGATPDQFTALRTLTEADPKGITQGQLTRLMSSDPNTIASLLERMEKAGWVERKRHETDRRAYRIKITAKGRKLFENLRDVAVNLQSQVLSVLDEADREDFLKKLATVADACREAADNSPKRKKS
ncbi:MAG: MarR family transcriptional regulator [Verrucomicrobiales bacterium]|nr:MarR family transcriptional regulator [Verrucomicrobiales bacterium]|tara:strand:- start:1783 stop:2283 length:501 start_codon:yes stop_codon:yes gene_type:complete